MSALSSPLDLGKIGFEIGLESDQIDVYGRQIRLRGEIVVRRLSQGFRECLRLLGREFALVPQRPRQAKRIEEKGGHGSTMERGRQKVHEPGASPLPAPA